MKFFECLGVGSSIDWVGILTAMDQSAQSMFSTIGACFVILIFLLVFDNRYLKGRYFQSFKRMFSPEEDWDALRAVCFKNMNRIQDIEALNKYLEDRIDALQEHFNQAASDEVKYDDDAIGSDGDYRIKIRED